MNQLHRIDWGWKESGQQLYKWQQTKGICCCFVRMEWKRKIRVGDKMNAKERQQVAAEVENRPVRCNTHESKLEQRSEGQG